MSATLGSDKQETPTLKASNKLTSDVLLAVSERLNFVLVPGDSR